MVLPKGQSQGEEWIDIAEVGIARKAYRLSAQLCGEGQDALGSCAGATIRSKSM